MKLSELIQREAYTKKDEVDLSWYIVRTEKGERWLPAQKLSFADAVFANKHSLEDLGFENDLEVEG